MIIECNRLLVLLIFGIWIIREESRAEDSLQRTFDEVVQIAMCYLRCSKEPCLTRCINEPEKITEFDEEAGADARLICRGQSYVVLAHNPGYFVIELRMVGSEWPLHDATISSSYAPARDFSLFYHCLIVLKDHYLQSRGGRLTINLLNPNTWYEFRLHRVTTFGISKPETMELIKTLPDAYYTPADVTNVTAKISRSMDMEIKWNAKISFQPSTGLAFRIYSFRNFEPPVFFVPKFSKSAMKIIGEIRNSYPAPKLIIIKAPSVHVSIDYPCIYQITCRPDSGNYTETTKLIESEEFHVTFKDLPPGANFTVSVRALTETQKWVNFPNSIGTVMTFSTPRCRVYLRDMLECVPSAVKGLNATTINKMENIFDVHLTWDKPEDNPDQYIVSIHPIGVRNMDRYSKTIYHRDKLETVFQNVTISDQFDVYIKALNRYGDGPQISRRFKTRLTQIGSLVGLNVTTTHKVGNTFDIHVTWKRPELIPDFYIVNVTLNSSESIDPVFQNISGSANETVFSDVLVLKEFDVYVTTWSSAIKGPVTSKFLVKMPTSVRQIDIFKPIHLAGTILVVISISIGIGIAVYGYYRLRKRRLRQGSQIDEFEMNSQNLIITRVLGNGAFGIVKLGSMRDDRGNVTPVAVKMLRDDSNENDRRHFLHEMQIMKTLDKHPNIISFLGCCTIGPYPFLVVEYCSRGDLHSFLRKSLEDMTMSVQGEILLKDTEDSSKSQSSDNYVQIGNISGNQDTNCNSEVVTVMDMLNFGRQIATGMEFLSSSRVVHRDLATRNVLVCHDRTIKISDFGLSRDIYQENIYKKSGNGRMPLKWMAIEALSHQVYTTYSDVWSFGVLLWEIVTLGGEPYPGIPTLELLKQLQSGYRMERPENCSIPLYDVMLSCWRTRPRDRPTFTVLRQELDKLICMTTTNEYVNLNDVAKQVPSEDDHSQISSSRSTFPSFP